MKSKGRRYLELVYHKVVILVFSAVGRLPKKNLFFFESFHGRQYSDNPRAIYEYLRENYPEIQCVWSVKKGFEQPLIDEKVPFVRRMGIKWLFLMPRAKYWVFNTRMPAWMKKTIGTIYVQTWHGTPLKRLGLDIERVNMPETDTNKYRKNFADESKRWDYLLSSNRYSTDIFRRAFDYKGEILEIGYPRNDVLQDIRKRNRNRKEILSSLNLSEKNRIILYAPTWRDNQFHHKGSYKYENHFPFSEILERDSEVIILLRTHYLVVDAISVNQYKGRVLDCSKYPDIRDLYLISDLLITDYSSVLFDYAYTKRPQLYYMYDKEEYDRNIRGFYFDPQEELPGLIVTKQAEVIEASLMLLSQAKTGRVNPRYQSFYEKYCSTSLVSASEQLITKLLEKSDEGENLV